MRLERLWLTDFRSYEQFELALTDGLTAVVGPNGWGKSNLLEAVAFLATLESFRSAPTEALVRTGAAQGVVRGQIVHEGGRTVLVECELTVGGRTRVLVNRQRLRRSRDLLGALRVTVFTPDDLELLKGGPAGRRRYLDEVLVAADATVEARRAEVDRVLRHRNALLRQVAGTRLERLPDDVAVTLDVWDHKLAEAGDALGAARARMVRLLEPELAEACAQISGRDERVELRYEPPWLADGLLAALRAARDEELRRGVGLVGPHRDEVAIRLSGSPARTHASQGEQRTLALGLRLAAHRMVTARTGTAPVLLLDDVFSELDAARADSLVRHLPDGQAVLTTATTFPASIRADRVVSLAEVTA